MSTGKQGHVHFKNAEWSTGATLSSLPNYDIFKRFMYERLSIMPTALIEKG